MEDIKIYESITDFHVFGVYYPKGTRIVVDSRNCCKVPKYVGKIPFECFSKWKFKEIDKRDIKESEIRNGDI